MGVDGFIGRTQETFHEMGMPVVDVRRQVFSERSFRPDLYTDSQFGALRQAMEDLLRVRQSR